MIPAFIFGACFGALLTAGAFLWRIKTWTPPARTVDERIDDGVAAYHARVQALQEERKHLRAERSGDFR